MKWMLIFLFFFVGYSQNRIDVNKLVFEFFPVNISLPIIYVYYPKTEKFSDTLLILKKKDAEYIWKNKTVLYKEFKEIGIYRFLCIYKRDGYEFYYSK